VTLSATGSEGCSLADLLKGFRDAGYNVYRIMSERSVLDSYLDAESTYHLAEISDSYNSETIDIIASKSILLNGPERILK